MSEEAFVDWHLSLLEQSFVAQVDPSHVAAIFVEPVQGEGGFVPAPFPWLQRLRELADEHGILLVSDEIQSGMGRTGTLWAIEHSGVVPDMITTAKSLAAGMPLSAVVGPADVMDAPHPGGLGGTYSGNPLACVAALEAMDQISQPAFLERSAAVGDRLRNALEEIQAAHPSLIGDVRGLGSMLVMEFVKDPATKQPWMEATAAVTARDPQARRHHHQGGSVFELRAFPSAARHHRRPAGRGARSRGRLGGSGCLGSRSMIAGMNMDFRQFIDGEWTGASNGGSWELINPATEEVIDLLPFGDGADAAAALDAAAAGFPGLEQHDSLPAGSDPRKDRGADQEPGRRVRRDHNRRVGQASRPGQGGVAVGPQLLSMGGRRSQANLRPGDPVPGGQPSDRRHLSTGRCGRA